MKSRAWKAFLPVPHHLKQDEPPDADLAWLLSRGIEGEALSVLRLLRRNLLPLVAHKTLAGFHFLIHSRAEGVPCPPEDSRAFIDLSLYFSRSVDARKMLREWCWVAPRRGEQKITPAAALLNAQSELYLRIVESCGESSDLDCLKQVRQSLHYFANMSQMRIA